uniref:Uncharacterized protein n=1 Tax=Anguilla anguilla TaxID=7936 RepID=A0A0E9T8X9_ANGAN
MIKGFFFSRQQEHERIISWGRLENLVKMTKLVLRC